MNTNATNIPVIDLLIVIKIISCWFAWVRPELLNRATANDQNEQLPVNIIPTTRVNNIHVLGIMQSPKIATISLTCLNNKRSNVQVRQDRLLQHGFYPPPEKFNITKVTREWLTFLTGNHVHSDMSAAYKPLQHKSAVVTS